MKKRYDIAAIGELLIDFIPEGKNDLGIPIFSANPGGAPPNVLAMYNKLGGSTAFIGKVGKDGFGDSLVLNLQNAGIDTAGVISDSKHNTTLAFVHLDESGDRSFSFYRQECADIMLNLSELPANIITSSDVFHFGSVSMTDEPARGATFEAVKLAKAGGAIISYDPNYRPLLWQDLDEAKRVMHEGAALADVIKVSDEELILITGITDISKGAEALISLGASLVFVTLGADGAFYMNKKANGYVKACIVKTVDTTGAGDTFFGAALWKLKGKSRDELSVLDKDELEEIVTFANAAGSLTTTKKGAIPAMPNYVEIINLINK